MPTNTTCKPCDAEDENTVLDSSAFFPDPAIKREIWRQSATCDTPDCPWKGIFKEYIQHTQICEYRMTSCDVCEEMIPINKMDVHQRSDCQGKSIPCPFGCNENGNEHAITAIDAHCLILLRKVQTLQTEITNRTDPLICDIQNRVSSIERDIELASEKLSQLSITNGDRPANAIEGLLSGQL